MPLPQNLPDWVYPSNLVIQIQSGLLFEIVSVTYLGPGGFGVGIQVVEGLDTHDAHENAHELTISTEALLRDFRPANNTRASHIVPVVGAVGTMTHPTHDEQEVIDFYVISITDHIISVEILTDQAIDLPLDVYRAHVLTQMMPAILPGSQAIEAGLPWIVQDINLGGPTDTVLLRSPRPPHSIVVSDLASISRGPLVSLEPRNEILVPAYMLFNTEEVTALVVVYAVEWDYWDVNIVGTARNERIRLDPEGQPVGITAWTFEHPWTQQMVFRRSHDRRYRAGDIFRYGATHIAVTNVEVVFDDSAYFDSYEEAVTFVMVRTVGEATLQILREAEYLGNGSQFNFGFPDPAFAHENEDFTPQPLTRVPFTRVPLRGFDHFSEREVRGLPVQRLSTFERLLADESD